MLEHFYPVALITSLIYFLVPKFVKELRDIKVYWAGALILIGRIEVELI